MVEPVNIGDSVYVAVGPRFFVPGSPHVGRYVVVEALPSGRFVIAYAPVPAYRREASREEMFTTHDGAVAAWTEARKAEAL